MGICKLCLNDKQLINKSHIIPEFMYQDLFDSNHKMYAFNPNEMSKGIGYIKKPSSGEYEGGLLCSDCDSVLLGSYEGYSSKAIYGGSLPENESPIFNNHKKQDGVQFTRCENISYKKFKIFLLSILWRASISTRPFFKHICLGPHEEIIRKMIYEGNAGEVSDYPIFLFTFANDKAMPSDLVANPQKRRMQEGHTTFVFMIGGMVYIYYVNSKNHKVPDHILAETIKPKNEMNIIHIPPGQGWNLILGFCGMKKKPRH